MNFCIQLDPQATGNMFLNIFANSRKLYFGFDSNFGQNVVSTYARKLENLWRFNGAVRWVSEDHVPA
jgi:hypothetical protein